MSRTIHPGPGICYTAAGHWKPSYPPKPCAVCAEQFTPHSKTQMYCSKSCAGRARQAARFKDLEYTERTCPGCGTKWRGPPSNHSRYCSKACIYDSGKWVKAEPLRCENCDSVFKPGKAHQKYCSKQCASEALLKPRFAKTCAQCGGAFVVNEARSDEITCSIECRTAYHIRDRHHAWRGGEVLQNDRLCRRIDREGYAAKYDGEHRLIAAREIGRPLERGMVVLCIDGDNSNIAPSNLFLCPSQSEHGLIRNGAVEWPAASNLASFRTEGYVRPDVRLTLHDWENGRRPGKRKGKWITRHPQADEIIKRRRAGATLRQLAEAFDTSVSNMAETLRRRL